MIAMGLQDRALLEVLVVEFHVQVMDLDEIQQVHRIIEGGEFAVFLINVAADVLHAFDALFADSRHRLFEFLVADLVGKDHAPSLPVVERLAHPLDRGVHGRIHVLVIGRAEAFEIAVEPDRIGQRVFLRRDEAHAQALAHGRSPHDDQGRKAAVHPAAQAHRRHDQLHEGAHHRSLGAQPADDDFLEPAQGQHLALVQQPVFGPFLAARGAHSLALVDDVVAAAFRVAGPALGVAHVDHQPDEVLADVGDRHEQRRAGHVGDPKVVREQAGLRPVKVETAVADLDRMFVVE